MVHKRRKKADLFTEAGADFDGEYRYDLFRKWDDRPMIVFIMLNPSTADENKLDPTVTRCMKFAIRNGNGGFHVVNLFALISTDPKALLDHPDPVGPLNGRYISRLAREYPNGEVVVAWGAHKAACERAEKVLKLLRKHRDKLYCLGKTKNGSPKHPLYVPYSAKLELYENS